jgi:Mn2+/Fe2+ NRAMP family transporter
MIITGAVMLYGHKNLNDIQTLALALKPVAGNFAFGIFSFGIIVSGLLALPVLAGSTAYAVADTFGWRQGMDNKVSDAKGFYFVFVGSLLVGDIIDMIPNISVVDALYYSQVLDGMLIPVLIGISLMISHNKEIMGEFIPKKTHTFFAFLTLIVTAVLSFIMIYQWIKG